jgi:hypothetical protein
VHRFPGGTKDQYEKALAAVHPSRDSLPKGQIFHAAGPSADGWTIMAVHDSKESWERFRDEILMPRFKKGIEGGLKGPAQETAFEVHNLQKAEQHSHPGSQIGDGHIWGFPTARHLLLSHPNSALNPWIYDLCRFHQFAQHGPPS